MTVILLVDDDYTFRETLKGILHSRFPSMDIAEAAEGSEALKSIERTVPTLIFMDIQLPGENGLFLTRRIKKSYPSLPIIILTNHDLPEYREAASDYGADAFLSKQETSLTELIEVVEALLADQHTAQRPGR
jgi:DNA-binding NarL/FixJ family response regulator